MLNILSDSRNFLYAQKSNNSRTGVYLVAYNLLIRLLNSNNVNVFLYFLEIKDSIKLGSKLCYTNHPERIEQYFTVLIAGVRIKFKSERKK